MKLKDDNEKFISDFVAAAKENNEQRMKELAETVTDKGLDARVKLLDGLVTALREEEANEEVTVGLEATLELMKLAAETKDNEDSTGEDAKDDTKAEEVTQDVTTAASAEEAKVDAPEASEEGEAPAKEEKAEKTEQ